MIAADKFPERLEELRKEKGVKKHVISELCGLNKNSVGRYEKGISEPTMRSLIQLADYFDVSIDYLVGRSEKR